MAINLGNNNSTIQTEVLNLRKNDILDLTKRNPGLVHIGLGAGWDIAHNGQAFDLDLSAFLLDENNRYVDVKNIVFFNNRYAQGVTLSEDNRTGAGDGDDEMIIVNLQEVSPNVKKIVFVVNIFDAINRHQTFGMINNSYIRLFDVANNKKELCRFNLKDDASTATAMIFCELYRNGNEWDFKAVGEGKIADLNGIALLY